MMTIVDLTCNLDNFKTNINFFDVYDSIPFSLWLEFPDQKTSSSSSLTKVSERGRSASIQSVDSASFSHHGSDIDLASRQLFDQVSIFFFQIKIFQT